LGAAASQQSGYGRWIETLADEIPVHAAYGECVVQRQAATEAAIQRLLEQLGFVELPEDLRYSVAGDIAGDAERFDLPEHPRPTVMTEAHIGSRTGKRSATVVQGTLETQPRDGAVDVFLIEFAPGEPRPQLHFGKFAAGQEREAGDIGPLGAVGHPLSSEAGDLGCAAARLRSGCHLVA
jgi:hypothetical protein